MLKEERKKISIVAPCHNEESVLPDFLLEVEKLFLQENSYLWELICIDDGSSDKTWEIISQATMKGGEVRGVALSRNFGHQAAVSAGLNESTGDCVAVIDADLQDPPFVLIDFLERWKTGCDVVYGVRKRRDDRLHKKLLAWIFYRSLRRLSSLEIPVDAGDFCLMDRRVVEVMKCLPERNRYLRGMRVWCGFEHCAVEFDRKARLGGEPAYTLRKSIKLALDGLFSFSAVPLGLASHAGLWISLIAFLGAVFTFFQRIFPAFFGSIGLAPEPGYATIVISILFLGGIQLICLGILGEYLGRIYEEVKGRPSWIVAKRTTEADPERED